MGITKSGNTPLNRVQFGNSNDECYTTYNSVVYGLKPYVDRGIFENKVIYSPCDSMLCDENHEDSAFCRYFGNLENWKNLRYKKYLCSTYSSGVLNLITEKIPEPGYKCECTPIEFPDGSCGLSCDNSTLGGNGSFLSPECIRLMEEADIVVTNPPFSKFRQFVDLLMNLKKDFIIIGHNLAVCYENWFDEIKREKIKFRYCGEEYNWYNLPADYAGPVKPTWRKKHNRHQLNINTGWYSNIILEDFEYNSAYPLNLTAEYSEEKYKRFDNYPNIISVDRVCDIPKDYYGEIAVPINYMVRHDPKQFRIVNKLDDGIIDGKEKFKRLVIKRV